MNRPKILVVEDDSEFRDLVKIFLDNSGFETVCCEDGAEILEIILNSSKNKLPDVIVTDLRMPNLNGMEFLRITHGVKVRPPVIIMTSFGSEDTRKEARLWGARGVLNKPFQLELLLEQINLVLKEQNA